MIQITARIKLRLDKLRRLGLMELITMNVKEKLLTKLKYFNRSLLILSLCFTSACSFGGKIKKNNYFDSNMVLLLDEIEKGDKFTSEQLIKNGSNLNSYGEEGITPLFFFIINKDLDAIELALQLGADPNFISGNNDHPIAYIVGDGDDKILELLLKYGGNANAVDHNAYPVIFRAIGHDNWNHINMLLEFGADLNRTEPGGDNAPLYSTSLNKFEICYQLIKMGAASNKPNSAGVTIAYQIESKLSKNLLSPEFEAYGWAIKTKELLISKGVEFPPDSPKEIRERIKNGQPIN